ncbi:MAG: S-4TM family putative pore-forming effector [bacterium]
MDKDYIDISESQNDDKNIKLLFAKYIYYNKGNRYIYCIILAVLIQWISSSFIDVINIHFELSLNMSAVNIVMSLVVFFIVNLFIKFCKECFIKGANFTGIFDDRLFSVGLNSNFDQKKYIASALCLKKRKSKLYNKKINDFRDWYNYCNGNKIYLIRSNYDVCLRWSKKLASYSIIFLTFFLLIIPMVIIWFQSNDSLSYFLLNISLLIVTVFSPLKEIIVNTYMKSKIVEGFSGTHTCDDINEYSKQIYKFRSTISFSPDISHILFKKRIHDEEKNLKESNEM